MEVQVISQGCLFLHLREIKKRNLLTDPRFFVSWNFHLLVNKSQNMFDPQEEMYPWTLQDLNILKKYTSLW